jgi:SAM-dependent methyltransferase
LDVGSGKGEFLYEAVKDNWEAVGIEPSEEFCEFAQTKYKVKAFHGSLDQSNEIQKSYFDVVSMNHVLEHVGRPHELLKLISCYLVEDGLIFIEVPNADSYFLRIIDIYFKLKKLNWSSRLSPLHPPYHKYGYTKQSLKYLLDKCGYKVVAVKTFFGKDRGYKKKRKGSIVEALLRDLVSTVVNFLGNRELLCVIAKQKS